MTEAIREARMNETQHLQLLAAIKDAHAVNKAAAKARPYRQ